MALYSNRRGPLGCCSSGSALAGFGADEPIDSAVQTAVNVPAGAASGAPLASLFGVSVAAGVTVWWLTRMLSKSR